MMGVRRVRVSDREIVETDRREGKVTDVINWTASADGKTLSVVDEDKLHGTKLTGVMDRQP